MSDDVQVLAKLPKEKSPRPDETDDVIVAARQGPFLVTAFHVGSFLKFLLVRLTIWQPELSNDTHWHRYFVQEARKYIAAQQVDHTT